MTPITPQGPPSQPDLVASSALCCPSSGQDPSLLVTPPQSLLPGRWISIPAPRKGAGPHGPGWAHVSSRPKPQARHARIQLSCPSFSHAHPGAPAGWPPSPRGHTVSASCQVLPLPAPPPEAADFDSWVNLSLPHPLLRGAQFVFQNADLRSWGCSRTQKS